MKRSSSRWKKKGQMRWKWQRKKMKKLEREAKADAKPSRSSLVARSSSDELSEDHAAGQHVERPAPSSTDHPDKSTDPVRGEEDTKTTKSQIDTYENYEPANESGPEINTNSNYWDNPEDVAVFYYDYSQDDEVSNDFILKDAHFTIDKRL